MSNYLKVEYSDPHTPHLFIFGNHPLIPYLIKELKEHFKIIHLTQEKFLENETLSKGYESIQNIHEEYLLKKNIEYAIIFYDDKKSKKDAFSLIDVFQKLHTKTLFILDVRTLPLHFDIVNTLRKKQHIFFITLGDLYGKYTDDQSFPLTNFIENAILNEKAVLTGNDLYSLFPIWDKDAIKTIPQILLTSKDPKKLYCLFYEHPQTYLSLIQLLKKLIPNLEIQYLKRKNYPVKDFDLNACMNELKAKTGLTPQLFTFSPPSFESSIQRLQSLTSPEVVLDRSPSISLHHNIKRYTLFIGVGLLSILVLPMCFLGMSLFFLQNAEKSFTTGNTQAFQTYAKASSFFLSSATFFTDPFLNSTLPFLSKDSLLPKYQSFKSIVHLATDVSELITLLDSKDYSVSMKQLPLLIAKVNHLYFSLEKLKAESDYVKNKAKKYIPFAYQEYILLAQILPELLGYNGQKEYLILFQNNAELRPTGGFIGSIGNLIVSNGTIKEFTIQDVYEGDGQLKAHVEPHYIVRRYLQPHLYLRDSNFYPDFEQSASYSALLYKLETQKEVNGVVAVDFEVIKEMLKKIGPIELFDYKTTLDHENVLDFLHTTIESNFFPGSAEKKELLQTLYTQLNLKIAEKKENYIKLLQLLPELAQEKHILFAALDSNQQKAFRLTGLSGSYQDNRKESASEIHDFLAINEANIGVNKANQYVQRKVKYDIQLNTTDITSKVIVGFTNKGEKPSPYVSYIRVFSPLGSSLKTISIDQKVARIVPAVTDFMVYEDKKFKPPDGLEVDSSIENGKQVFGFITTVPKNGEQIIEISYRNGLKIPDGTLFTYDFLYIKQPGTIEYPLEINLRYPSDYEVRKRAEEEVKENEMVIKKVISSDTRVTVELERK